jgi:glycerol uptake facilitator-like aquaporin
MLVAIVVGSGIAAAELSPDDVGLQLLENSIATALGLTVLILALGPVSGAHFNPAVSLVDYWLSRRDGRRVAVTDVASYIVAQCVGGITGALTANVMFGVDAALATTRRASGGHLVAEIVATAGLVLVIFSLTRSDRAALAAPAVGAYIGAAYWFTSSTSFANPAVTIGRVFSDTFGIAPSSVAAFIAVQLVGAVFGMIVVLALYPTNRDPEALTRLAPLPEN